VKATLKPSSWGEALVTFRGCSFSITKILKKEIGGGPFGKGGGDKIPPGNKRYFRAEGSRKKWRRLNERTIKVGQGWGVGPRNAHAFRLVRIPINLSDRSRQERGEKASYRARTTDLKDLKGLRRKHEGK